VAIPEWCDFEIGETGAAVSAHPKRCRIADIL
jgi:hypothetical protein